MQSATEILSEHGINLMSFGDSFNTQLLHAMERYKETYSEFIEEGAEMWKAEYENCRDILQKLVGLNGTIAEPKVLEAAKIFLSKYQHQ